jgi:hypothetical protein
MSLESGDSHILKMDSAGRRSGLERTLSRRLMELWLAAVVVTFFLIRVLGSHTAQRLLAGVWHSHLP